MQKEITLFDVDQYDVNLKHQFAIEKHNLRHYDIDTDAYMNQLRKIDSLAQIITPH